MKYIAYVWLTTMLLCSCNKEQKLFQALSSSQTGITFSNSIVENNNYNILNYEYLYNGGGVAIGDFNNDSLQDIYFTGNLVSNALYLNKGNFSFKDVTKEANVTGEGKWCKGASVIDINNDGLLDIYVLAGVIKDSVKRKNILYINKGIDKSTGIPSFSNEAEAYGLADATSSQMAAFFDYDKDGDLDVYILENDLDGTYPNAYRPIIKDGSKPNTDKLFRNDFNTQLGHAVFTDVSKQAGIQIEGYGLGVSITDINNDGWPDVYVSNDYLSNNLLYINNKDGTFTDRCADYFKHTSKNAMGNDIADINNDGLQDIIEVDMAPADNYRQKMMMNDISYQTYQNNAIYGYMTQYARNMLQLNTGMYKGGNDSIHKPVFAEIAYSAGIAHTDWSWAPLLVDIDNDGYKDIMISNGLPKDMSDQDFISYRENAMPSTSRQELLAQLPAVKIPNYVYKNNGNNTFSNKTEEWGWNFPTFSAGMAYADFDNDGDMDCVVNNTNMEASLLENKQQGNNYIQFVLQGDSINRNAIGSTIHVYVGKMHQTTMVMPYRGYNSSVSNIIHVGLGSATMVDSIIVEWPNTGSRKFTSVPVNQRMNIPYTPQYTIQHTYVKPNYLLEDVTSMVGINHIAREEDQVDFNIQRLMPHKLSQYGPAMAVGDVNGDNLEDVIIGSGMPLYARLFTQQANGSFIDRRVVDSTSVKYSDDAGLCLFDADNDNDLDLYISSGNADVSAGSINYADKFYINDGKGNFKLDTTAIPKNYAFKSCVKAADYDNDGDIDIFIGVRGVPREYPKAAGSILLRNDSKPGNIRFTDVTATVAPGLQQAGMVCDAIWTDVNNDNYIDLMLAGEFTPVMVYKNDGKGLQKQQTILDKEFGWWNSICGSDIDNDGDIDYVAGNFGNNSFLKASQQYPVVAWGKDFDNNASYNTIIGNYQIDKINGHVDLFPVASRDEFLKEMSVLREKFPNYKSFASTPMKQIFNNNAMQNALQLSATNFNTSWIENKGNFSFEIHALPPQMQWAPVYGILCKDADGDGNVDIISVGNDFSMNPYLGHISAYQGVVCKGDGKGNFTPMPIDASGFYVPGSGKSLVELFVKNKPLVIAGQNKAAIKCFANTIPGNNSIIVPVKPKDRYAVLTYVNGTTRRHEFYYGSSFQSQPSRNFLIDGNVKQVSIFNNKNEKRLVDIKL
jgi:enediyne biosynthesis protein E4